jgi:two-component system response regulator ChvI
MYCTHCGTPWHTELQPQAPLIKGRLELVADRARWNGTDVRLTAGEFRVVSLLVSAPGTYRTYRLVYDVLRNQPGFIAGSGATGYKANVRSTIKRIRNKFRTIDPAFDHIRNYSSFGYCWDA